MATEQNYSVAPLTPDEKRAYDRNHTQVRYAFERIFPTAQGLAARVQDHKDHKELQSFYGSIEENDRVIRNLMEDITRSIKQSGFHYEQPEIIHIHRPVEATTIVATGSSLKRKSAYNRQSMRLGLKILSRPYIGIDKGQEPVIDLHADARGEAFRQALASHAFDFTAEENEAIAEYKARRRKAQSWMQRVADEYLATAQEDEQIDEQPEPEAQDLPRSNYEHQWSTEGVKPSRLTRTEVQMRKRGDGPTLDHNEKRRQGIPRNPLPYIRGVITLTGDKPDLTHESTIERTTTYSTANLILEAAAMNYQGALPRGPYSAAPGQLERPDLIGKPQDIPMSEDLGSDIIGDLIPSQFAMTLEQAALWARSESQLDHREISLENVLEDVGTDGERVIVVPNKAKHSDPFRSNEYAESLVSRIDRA